MIVDGFAIKDMFGFVGVTDIDVRRVAPGLIGIVGPNGAGKTGLMEIVPAINYGKCPGRLDDPPVDYATSRASFMEYRFRAAVGDDSVFKALLTLDVDARNTDGQLDQIHGDGRVVPFNDGKVSTLRKALAGMGLPSFDLFINSNFAGQGRGDVFVRMKDSKKKDLYAEFLGLVELIRMAKTAGVNAAKCQTVRDRLMAVARTLSADADESILVTLDEREGTARIARDAALHDRDTLQRRIQVLEARLATFHDAVTAYGAADLRVQTLTADLQTRRREVESLATEQAAALERFQADVKAAEADRDVTLTTLTARQRGLESDPELTATLAEIDGRIAQNNALRNRADDVRRAAALVESATTAMAGGRQQLDDQQRALAATMAAIRDTERQIASLKPIEQRRDRATTDAALLSSVPCEGAAPYDSCQFLKNAKAGRDELASLVEQLRPGADLAELLAAQTVAKQAIDEAIALLQTKVASDRQVIEANQEDADLLIILNASEQRLADLDQMRAAAVATSTATLQRRRADLDQQIADVTTRCATTLATLRQRYQLAEADFEQRRQSLTARVTALQTDLAVAEADRSAVTEGNTAAATAQTDLDAARVNAEDALRRSTLATSMLDDVNRARDTYHEKRRQLDAVTAVRDQVDAALVEWSSLQADLGKGGLVDLEIDSSVDTITSHANQMLMSCYGARFSMRMITQSEKVDGGMKDDFDVEAIDNTDAAGWRPIRTFSGGQRTIIQEALMLAMAIYVNERSALPIRTLWRDETGGQLDESNARHYIDMLRKARELGQFHHIYFITQDREIGALADAQIVVGDGTAKLVMPPFGARDTTVAEAA